MTDFSLQQLPVSWLILATAVAAALIRIAQLRWRDGRRAPVRHDTQQQAEAARQQLAALQVDNGVLPATFGQLPAGWCYRAVPTLQTDRRLLLLHEDEPRQLLVRFPGEEAARAVLFADGRLEFFTESAFERLLAGDNVLRARLQLPELDVHGQEA